MSGSQCCGGVPSQSSYPFCSCAKSADQSRVCLRVTRSLDSFLVRLGWWHQRPWTGCMQPGVAHVMYLRGAVEMRWREGRRRRGRMLHGDHFLATRPFARAFCSQGVMNAIIGVLRSGRFVYIERKRPGIRINVRDSAKAGFHIGIRLFRGLVPLRVYTTAPGLVQVYILMPFNPFPGFGVFRSPAFPPRVGLDGQREPQGARQTAPLGGAGPHDQTS